MKRALLCVFTIAFLTECQYVRDPYPELVETQTPLVSGCDMLGLISETAHADQPFSSIARRDMVARVKARADQLGATHIVWLHKIETSTAAEAYYCKDR